MQQRKLNNGFSEIDSQVLEHILTRTLRGEDVTISLNIPIRLKLQRKTWDSPETSMECQCLSLRRIETPLMETPLTENPFHIPDASRCESCCAPVGHCRSLRQLHFQFGAHRSLEVAEDYKIRQYYPSGINNNLDEEPTWSKSVLTVRSTGSGTSPYDFKPLIIRDGGTLWSVSGSSAVIKDELSSNSLFEDDLVAQCGKFTRAVSVSGGRRSLGSNTGGNLENPLRFFPAGHFRNVNELINRFRAQKISKDTGKILLNELCKIQRTLTMCIVINTAGWWLYDSDPLMEWRSRRQLAVYNDQNMRTEILSPEWAFSRRWTEDFKKLVSGTSKELNNLSIINAYIDLLRQRLGMEELGSTGKRKLPNLMPSGTSSPQKSVSLVANKFYERDCWECLKCSKIHRIQRCIDKTNKSYSSRHVNS